MDHLRTAPLLAGAILALALPAAAPAGAAPLTKAQYAPLINKAGADFQAAAQAAQTVTPSATLNQGTARLRTFQLRAYGIATRILGFQAPPEIKPVNDRLGRYVRAIAAALTPVIEAGRQGDRSAFVARLRTFMARLNGRLGRVPVALANQIDRYLGIPAGLSAPGD